ncbi:hypothetical protein FACS189472_12980 [Alphaproteobacteria bacterium]|nr:hypothetical protein FACS189472_12980 [Alphaproteobacteria bacterium]
MTVCGKNKNQLVRDLLFNTPELNPYYKPPRAGGSSGAGIPASSEEMDHDDRSSSASARSEPSEERAPLRRDPDWHPPYPYPLAERDVREFVQKHCPNAARLLVRYQYEEGRRYGGMRRGLASRADNNQPRRGIETPTQNKTAVPKDLIDAIAHAVNEKRNLDIATGYERRLKERVTEDLHHIARRITDIAEVDGGDTQVTFVDGRKQILQGLAGIFWYCSILHNHRVYNGNFNGWEGEPDIHLKATRELLPDDIKERINYATFKAQATRHDAEAYESLAINAVQSMPSTIDPLELIAQVARRVTELSSR